MACKSVCTLRSNWFTGIYSAFTVTGKNIFQYFFYNPGDGRSFLVYKHKGLGLEQINSLNEMNAFFPVQTVSKHPDGFLQEN